MTWVDIDRLVLLTVPPLMKTLPDGDWDDPRLKLEPSVGLNTARADASVSSASGSNLLNRGAIRVG